MCMQQMRACDSSHLVTSAFDETAIVWNTDDGRKVASLVGECLVGLGSKVVTLVGLVGLGCK